MKFTHFFLMFWEQAWETNLNLSCSPGILETLNHCKCKIVKCFLFSCRWRRSWILSVSCHYWVLLKPFTWTGWWSNSPCKKLPRLPFSNVKSLKMLSVFLQMMKQLTLITLLPFLGLATALHLDWEAVSVEGGAKTTFSRVKRADKIKDTTKDSITQGDRTAFVTAHNDARSIVSPTASNMPFIVSRKMFVVLYASFGKYHAFQQLSWICLSLLSPWQSHYVFSSVGFFV